MESISDIQKYLFRSNPANKAHVCNKGLFSWSRHPNYFGEIIIQFSIFMIAVSPAASGYVRGAAYRALYASILGPIFLTVLLMFVSGLTLQERPGAKKRWEKDNNWEEYARWLRRTSILIPFPPALYERCPVFLKRTLFLELPIYVFDPEKHSDMQKGEGAVEEGEHNGERVGHKDDESRDEGHDGEGSEMRPSQDQLVGTNRA